MSQYTGENINKRSFSRFFDFIKTGNFSVWAKYEFRIKNENEEKKVASFCRGFTLVEMLVSIALFSFIMMATTSVLLSVVDANHKAQGLKTTIDNLSMVIESMARNLRTGRDYTPLAGASLCNSGTGATGIQFKDHLNRTIQYRLDAGVIEISKDIGVTYTAITAPEIVIDRLCFHIGGIVPSDNIQPNILITIGGIVNPATVVGAKQRTTSHFDLQTFVTQRIPDVLN